MSNIKTSEFQSNLFEELDDADLMAVTGGGLVGDAVGTVTSTNSALGNGAQPTSGAVLLAAGTVTATGDYLTQVGNGTESGLQAANAGVATTADNV